MKPTVAVTGAAGRIGRALAERLASEGYRLTLLDLPNAGLGALGALGTRVELDLADPPPDGLFDGIDVVVHLAGEPNQHASWERLFPANIVASYHVASAAMRAGCQRFIAASSVHAVMASPMRPVAADGPVSPADLYGVTKCFVEALAFWCAHHSGTSAAAVRIGGFQPIGARPAQSFADVFIGAPDLISLLERAITAEYRFAILHASAPGANVVLDTRATEALLNWTAEYRFPSEPSP